MRSQVDSSRVSVQGLRHIYMSAKAQNQGRHGSTLVAAVLQKSLRFFIYIFNLIKKFPS